MKNAALSLILISLGACASTAPSTRVASVPESNTTCLPSQSSAQDPAQPRRYTQELDHCEPAASVAEVQPAGLGSAAAEVRTQQTHQRLRMASVAVMNQCGDHGPISSTLQVREDGSFVVMGMFAGCVRDALQRTIARLPPGHGAMQVNYVFR